MLRVKVRVAFVPNFSSRDEKNKKAKYGNTIVLAPIGIKPKVPYYNYEPSSICTRNRRGVYA